MHCLFSVYFANQNVHVSGMFVAHLLTGLGWNSSIPTRPTEIQLKSTTHYQLLYIYSIPPDDGLQICPKHVGVD